MRGLRSLPCTLKNEYELDAEEYPSPVHKEKLSDKGAMTPLRRTSDKPCAESKDIQHISIGHDPGEK